MNLLYQYKRPLAIALMLPIEGILIHVNVPKIEFCLVDLVVAFPRCRQ